jgi:hypothetical protein
MTEKLKEVILSLSFEFENYATLVRSTLSGKWAKLFQFSKR